VRHAGCRRYAIEGFTLEGLEAAAAPAPGAVAAFMRLWQGSACRILHSTMIIEGPPVSFPATKIRLKRK